MPTQSHTEFVSVHANDGPLRGHRRGEGAVFLGVPYALPPVGVLRWRPPQALAPWKETRDALNFGPDFPQASNPRLRAPRQDEDCLYLNIWTPTLDRAARLPVMV